jgi:DNA-binding CsgD family transcriptional regulator
MYLEMIDCIYAAVTDTTRWEDLLELVLEDECFAACAIGYQADLKDMMITGVVSGPDEAEIEHLYTNVLPDNPLMQAGLVLTPGPHVLMDHEIMPREEFVQTNYHAWLDRIGAHRVMAGIYRVGRIGSVHFPCYVRKGREPGRAQREMMETLLPHLKRALALSRELESLRSYKRRSSEAINRAHFGCILVGAGRRIEWMNEYADSVLLREDALRSERGVLEAAHPDERGAFAGLLDAVLDGAAEGGGPRRLRKIDAQEGMLDLLVSPFSPFGHPIVAQRGGAMVLIADPDYLEEGIADRLAVLYGLTPTESETTQWLLSGSTVDEIAGIFGRSTHTVRHHVKSVLRKVGVSSQAQLVGLIHRGIARLSDEA